MFVVHVGFRRNDDHAKMADLAKKLGAKERVKYNSSSKMQIIIIQTSSKYPATSGTDGKIETKTPEKLLPQGKISMVFCFFPLINFQKNNTKHPGQNVI